MKSLINQYHSITWKLVHLLLKLHFAYLDYPPTYNISLSPDMCLKKHFISSITYLKMKMIFEIKMKNIDNAALTLFFFGSIIQHFH